MEIDDAGQLSDSERLDLLEKGPVSAGTQSGCSGHYLQDRTETGSRKNIVESNHDCWSGE